MTHYLRDQSGAALADDAELERVTAYTGGFMSEMERAQFERDFVRDEKFAHRVAPFLKLFYSRTALPNADAARARIQARRARRQREAIAAQNTAIVYPAPTDAVVIDITPRLVERRRRRIPIYGFLGAAAAAALAFAILRTGQQQPSVRPTLTAEKFNPPVPDWPRVGTTPVTAPARPPKPVQVRQVAVRTPASTEVPIMRVADDSLQVALPGTQLVVSKAVADVGVQEEPITVVASPLDTSYENAKERLRELIEMEKKALADAQAKRPIWIRLPQWIGGLFPRGKPHTAKPPSEIR